VIRLITQLLRQYWLQLLATAVFVAAGWRYWQLGRWLENIDLILIAFGSLVAVIAADEFAEWTGNYGWTRQQWRQWPEWFVRGAGMMALVVVTVLLFRAH
jgi:hypothetical protein